MRAVCQCTFGKLSTLITGDIVAGTFHCKKSETNSRELDVEIHYSVKKPDSSYVMSSGDITVQMYKVR